MLVQFVIDNYLSFNERQEFSMFMGRSRIHQNRVKGIGDNGLLKFAALFGANASGKSNFIKAMACMDRTVEQGKVAISESDNYCRISVDNKKRTSYFETVILLDGNYYSYGFEAILAKNEILSEWLIHLSAKGEEEMLFMRELPKKKLYLGSRFSKDTQERLNIYAQDMQDERNLLFLSTMNKGKKALYSEFADLKILNEVYQWFNHTFLTSEPDKPVTSGEHYMVDKKLEKVSRLLHYFDTDIIKIETKETSLSEISQQSFVKAVSKQVEQMEMMVTRLFENNPKATEHSMLFRDRNNFLWISKRRDRENLSIRKIFFTHSGGESFSIGEESDGTMRIMDLAEILLTDESRVFVIDELDRCLHPQLSYAFVKLFLEHAEKHDIQLIVSTHESRLLDFELLRRDEIWFVEKKQGVTRLYSLEEFNERNDRKIDKAYMDGRYGGVPIFTTIFPLGEVT
jgi:AAA15 family ATPase/GTPase